MNIFVSDNDKIDVDVYVWKETGDAPKINATEEVGKIPEEYKNEAKIIKFVFHRPNFRQSNIILQAVGNETSAGVNMQELIINTLLIEIINEGERVAVQPKNSGKLDPVVARAAANGLLDRVQMA
jgi:hypothetical protein